MTKAFARLIAFLITTAMPVLAAEEPDELAGFWRLGAASDGASCEIELLGAIAYEFEGVWYVARPLHYEDNRATCRQLGIDDIVAWSMPEAGDRLWLLAEGEAGFMEFDPAADDGWMLAQSGHADLPPFAITKLPGPPTE